MFSGGVDINVIKNETDEASETGKVGGGIGRKEGDQIGPDVEGVDCRDNEQDLTKENLGGGSISPVLVKTEDVEEDDDDEEEEDEEEDDSDENDDEEEEEEEEEDDDDNEMNDKRRKNLPCNSSETEHGETAKLKEHMNEKPEVV
jgi:hypothetical protein